MAFGTFRRRIEFAAGSNADIGVSADVKAESEVPECVDVRHRLIPHQTLTAPDDEVRVNLWLAWLLGLLRLLWCLGLLGTTLVTAITVALGCRIQGGAVPGRRHW